MDFDFWEVALFLYFFLGGMVVVSVLFGEVRLCYLV